MTKGHIIRRCVARARDELYPNNLDRNPYNKICNENINKTWIKYLKAITTIVVSMTFANIVPLYISYQNGEKITLTALKVPLFDEGSDEEYLNNLTIQAFYALFFIPANISIEGATTLVADSIILSSKLIQLQAECFSRIMESNRCNRHQMKRELLTILRQIHCTNSWIEEYFRAVYWRYFLSPIFFSFAISISIYCQYIVSIFCIEF